MPYSKTPVSPSEGLGGREADRVEPTGLPDAQVVYAEAMHSAGALVVGPALAFVVVVGIIVAMVIA